MNFLNYNLIDFLAILKSSYSSASSWCNGSEALFIYSSYDHKHLENHWTNTRNNIPLLPGNNI